MDFIELLDKRHSTRDFSDKEIIKEDLKEAINLAMKSHSSKNDQPQRIIVVESNEKKDLLKKSLTQDYNAKSFIILAYDETISRTRDYKNLNGGIISSSIFAGYLMLALSYKDIDSIWIGASDLANIKKNFNLKDISPIGVLAIGYESEKAKASKDHFDRKDVDEIASFL